MSKDLKVLITGDLEKKFKALQSYVLVDYRGLNSAQSFDLRKTLHGSGISMSVVPNRLAVRVLDQWSGKQDAFKTFFRGPTALVFGTDGAISASKVLYQWKKKNKDLLPIKGGVLEGQVIPPQMVESLSKIPDRQQLLAQVAGGFQAPVARLAAATRSIVARVAYALEARRKKLEEAGGDSGANAAAAAPSPATAG